MTQKEIEDDIKSLKSMVNGLGIALEGLQGQMNKEISERKKQHAETIQLIKELDNRNKQI